MVDPSFWNLLVKSVTSASWLELAVLLFLVLLSILSWAVIIQKVNMLRLLKRQHLVFNDVFSTAAHSGEVAERGRGTGGPSLLYTVFSAGMLARAQAVPDPALTTAAIGDHLPLHSSRDPDERIRLVMEHALKSEMQRLNRHLQFLASAGSASPFIGLFGTVWGIMGTFQTLGNAKSASLQVLAPPIAAALIATAAGLAVAIPAVMAYNWITARLDEEEEGATCLMERLVHLVRANRSQADQGLTALPTNPA
jgi:biopolymer transport protein TolQ